MDAKTYHFLVGTILGLAALLHLLRVLLGWEFTIGGAAIPTWVSLLGVVVAGFLSYQSFRFARK